MHAEPEIKTKPLYEKPRLQTIELTAEEVMGGGCKVLSAPIGAGMNNCATGPCNTTFGS